MDLFTLFSNLDKNVATIKMAISNTHLLLFWKFSKAQITSRYSCLTATSHNTWAFYPENEKFLKILWRYRWIHFKSWNWPSKLWATRLHHTFYMHWRSLDRDALQRLLWFQMKRYSFWPLAICIYFCFLLKNRFLRMFGFKSCMWLWKKLRNAHCKKTKGAILDLTLSFLFMK